MKKLITTPDNVPGLSRIVAIPVEAFRAITVNPTSGKKSLTLFNLDNCVEIETNRNEDASDQLTFANEGNSYLHQVTGKIFNRNFENSGLRDILFKGRWLVFVTDCNGIHRLYGTTDVPLRFTYQQVTSKFKSGSSYTSYTFGSTQLEPSSVIDYHPL